MKTSLRVKVEIQIVCHMSCIIGSLFGFFALCIFYYLSFQYSIHQSHVWKYFQHQGLLSKQTGSLMMSSTIYLKNKFLLLQNAFELSTCTFGCGHMFYVSYNFIQSASNMTSDLENRQQQEIRSF